MVGVAVAWMRVGSGVEIGGVSVAGSVDVKVAVTTTIRWLLASGASGSHATTSVNNPVTRSVQPARQIRRGEVDFGVVTITIAPAA
jgi:hypothetical protein